MKGTGLSWMVKMLGERHLRRCKAIVRINEMTPKTLTPSAWCIMLILALLSLTRQSLPLINVLPTLFLEHLKESSMELWESLVRASFMGRQPMQMHTAPHSEEA